jgi:tRNA (guanine-N7-)-methyltransferase
MKTGGGSFFGRRKGKSLKPSQREALRTALPALLLDLSNSPPKDLSELFPVPVDEFRLEIGFGAGEHLLYEAGHLPGAGFLGVEPFENSLAKAITAIRRDGMQNVRLFNQDAVLLLDWLPPASLVRIDLLYPDPWPKTRHWKRRFVNAANLERIARCLKPDGIFRFASDVDAYVKWTLREVARHGKLVWSEASIEQCRAPWPGWSGTRYEAKATVEGRSPAYLTFRKTG